MAIIIPTECIYELTNDKIIDNKIDGVYYQELGLKSSIVSLWRTTSNPNGGTTQTTFKSEGNWEVNRTNETERKRLVCQVITVNNYYTIASGIIADSINWEKLYLDVSQSISGMGTSQNLSYTFAFLQEANMPIIPSPYISSDILNWFGNSLFQMMSSASVMLDPYIRIYISRVNNVDIVLETQDLQNEEWVTTSSETLYSKAGSTFSNCNLYLNNSVKTGTTVLIGNTKTAYSLPSNELFTKACFISGDRLGTYVSNAIIKSYSNGKETATVLCSISDYYDELGEQVKFIDGEDMVFNIYDVVIPMKYAIVENGLGDIPISQKQDLTPKSFVVLGVEIYYDGAVWQKLTLQEL